MRSLILLALLLGSIPTVMAQVNKFENDIVSFENKDKLNPPVSKKLIVFAGSSSIVRWSSLLQDYADKNVINRGFGGSQTTDLIEYADRVISVYHPDQVFIYEGDNDLSDGKTPLQVFNNFKILFEKIRTKDAKIQVSFISIKPSPSRRKLLPSIKETNTLIKEFLSTQKRTDFINIFDPMLAPGEKFIPELYEADSLHMTPKGYEIWAKQIKPYIKD